MAHKKATTESGEKFVLLSGTHIRVEDGVRVKYRSGDLISVNLEEIEQLGPKLMRLEAFEVKINEHERQQAEAEERFEKATSPRKSRDKERDPEAVARGQKALEVQRSKERRITI